MSSERVMHLTILKSLPAVCLAAVLLASTASAEPKTPAEPTPPAEEKMSDASFAESFVGKTYEGNLGVEGWSSFGGGLVSPPIYVHQYQREDGTFLALTSKQTGKATYLVTDSLIVRKPRKGQHFTIACTQGKDPMLRFMGVAKGSEDREWWADVRRVWEISLETGEITKVKNKGTKCANPAW